MTYTITTTQLIAIITLAVWELVWKGAALWQAAHHNQPYWFVALLLINSAGVLPIIYLLIADFHAEEAPIDDDEPYIDDEAVSRHAH